MKKTWIGLGLSLALCLPLAGCAGNKTGGDIMPGTTTDPTTQSTPTAMPNGTDNDVIGSNGETNTDAANGGNNVSGAPVGDDNAYMGTTRGTGRANDSALEQVGDGVKDTLDDLGNGARRMAQDAKRAME